MRRGMTLIELVIVLVIVGIIARPIAVPSLIQFGTRAAIVRKRNGANHDVASRRSRHAKRCFPNGDQFGS